MEELKDVETTEQMRPETAATPQTEEPQKSFSQDDVNRIVQERLARERERINSMINEDEGIRKELTANRLKLEAAKELSEAGLSLDFVDLVNCTDEKSCKDSLAKISKIYEVARKQVYAEVYRENGRTPERGYGGPPPVHDKLRNAFRPKGV